MNNTTKALIVEDSELQAALLEDMLTDFGIKHIDKAGNGLHALELFSAALDAGNPYSLVFLDIVMPEMNGQEALKRIRDKEKDAGSRSVIIMVTSLDSPAEMIEALLQGDCTDYIVKPPLDSILKTMLTKYGLLEV